MHRRPILFLAGLLALLVVAYLLRKPIYEAVIIPLAYIWWVFGIYYHWIPQVIYWGVLTFFVLYTSVRTLIVEIPFGKKVKLSPRLPQGPVEKLSVLIQKRERGMYYKWLLANRLGKLARDLLDQRDGFGAGGRSIRLSDRKWNPPAEVLRYLESGLDGSFADHPKTGWLNPKSTPLDEDPQRILGYLESEMEKNHHGNR
jgi:hypothetical protein